MKMVIQSFLLVKVLLLDYRITKLNFPTQKIPKTLPKSR